MDLVRFFLHALWQVTPPSSHMSTPSLDIILPVWNSPDETRFCLVCLLPIIEAGARLILINNGCDRVTGQLLEEFSEPLGNQVIYMTMERNIGFVPALNRGLHRSDADWTLLLRPSVIIKGNFLKWLEFGAKTPQSGILTPFIADIHPLPQKLDNKRLASIETCDISFDLLAVSKAVRDATGQFNEELDNGFWCLQDYRRRALLCGFFTHLVTGLSFATRSLTILGSAERRRQLEEQSRDICRNLWGTQQRYAIYFPVEADLELLSGLFAQTLAAARLGHSFHLFLHHRLYREAIRQGLDVMHTCITLHKLPLLLPLRRLSRQMASLILRYPELLTITAVDRHPLSRL